MVMLGLPTFDDSCWVEFCGIFSFWMDSKISLRLLRCDSPPNLMKKSEKGPFSLMFFFLRTLFLLMIIVTFTKSNNKYKNNIFLQIYSLKLKVAIAEL